jgi:ribosomal protein S18 acetylase RimI-like enzyme
MRLLSLALGDYGIYKIFADISGTAPKSGGGPLTVSAIDDPNTLAHSPHGEIASLASYARTGAWAFGAWLDGDLAACCWYSDAAADSQGSTWPIEAREAKLLQITTAQRFRGRGLARALIRQSAAMMRERGFGPLYARVWHSNTASQAAFLAAGWVRRALVIEFAPFGIGRSRRILIERRPG